VLFSCHPLSVRQVTKTVAGVIYTVQRYNVNGVDCATDRDGAYEAGETRAAALSFGRAPIVILKKNTNGAMSLNDFSAAERVLQSLYAL